MAKFDVDPHALAEEVSVLLKQEEKKPKAIRMSFKQLTACVYRGHNIRGEVWHEYNSAIGKILRARPRVKIAKARFAEKDKRQAELDL